MRCLALPFALSTAALLTACASVPERGASAAPAVVTKPRCDGQPATGSRLARCDSNVTVISGDEIRATGIPGSGAGRGAETRGGP
jgi:hypothetical protein